MSSATLPEVVAFVNARLNKVNKTFTGASINSPGTPGTVPAPTAGPNVRVLTSDGSWTTVNITHLNLKSFTQWQTATLYDVQGLFLTDQGRLFRVQQIHTATQIDADLLTGKLIEIGGMDEVATTWVSGAIYDQHHIAVFNGQLVQSQATHVATSFAADCLLGIWKFIANTSFSTTPTGTSYYSFMGHTVVKDNRLWSCITPHVSSTWIQANWLSLQRDFTGATLIQDGAAGMVPAPGAGLPTRALTADGNWTDLLSLVGQSGQSAQTTASLAVLNSSVTTLNSAVSMLQTNVSTLTANLTTLTQQEAGGVNPNAISINTVVTTSIMGQFTAVDTSVGAVTLTLPASPNVGDTYSFIDAKSTWGTYPVTIAAAKIHGVVQTAILDVSGANVTFKYMNTVTGWAMLSD